MQETGRGDSPASGDTKKISVLIVASYQLPEPLATNGLSRWLPTA